MAAAPIQWTQAQGGNGHWYELVSKDHQITWASALSEISAMSYQGQPGYFATVSSQAENEWIFSSVVVQGPTWLGGINDGSGWRWQNGEKWQYSAWAPGQPDGFLGGVQHTLYYIAAPLWDDAPDHWGGIPSQYVVEYNVPEPSSMLSLLSAAGLLGSAMRRRRK